MLKSLGYSDNRPAPLVSLCCFRASREQVWCSPVAWSSIAVSLVSSAAWQGVQEREELHTYVSVYLDLTGLRLQLGTSYLRLVA